MTAAEAIMSGDRRSPAATRSAICAGRRKPNRTERKREQANAAPAGSSRKIHTGLLAVFTVDAR